MNKEELDVQKEIEEYFTESAGFGRDKIQNFMDIVNKALKQKGEQIAKLEGQIEKMRNCLNCKHSEEDNKSSTICDECFELCYWEMKE